MLVFLNPDTVVGPGALRQLARTLEDPAVGIAMARLLLLDRPGAAELRAAPSSTSAGSRGPGGFGEPAETSARSRTWPPRAVRRWRSGGRRFRELGGFTDELFMYQEDVELSWRAHLAGLRVVVDPGADVFHEYEFGRHPSKIALLERNRLIFVLTAYPPRLLLLRRRCSRRRAGDVALSARRRWFRGKVGGWWWCLRNARWLVRHRRETKRLRRVPIARSRGSSPRCSTRGWCPAAVAPPSSTACWGLLVAGQQGSVRIGR